MEFFFLVVLKPVFRKISTAFVSTVYATTAYVRFNSVCFSGSSVRRDDLKDMYRRVISGRHHSLEVKLQWVGCDLDLASEKLCGDPISLFLRSCQRGLLGSIVFLVLDQGWKNIQAPQWHHTLSFSSTANQTFLWLFHAYLLLYGIDLQRGPTSGTKYIKYISYFSISVGSCLTYCGVYSFSSLHVHKNIRILFILKSNWNAWQNVFL